MSGHSKRKRSSAPSCDLLSLNTDVFEMIVNQLGVKDTVALASTSALVAAQVKMCTSAQDIMDTLDLVFAEWHDVHFDPDNHAKLLRNVEPSRRGKAVLVGHAWTVNWPKVRRYYKYYKLSRSRPSTWDTLGALGGIIDKSGLR